MRAPRYVTAIAVITLLWNLMGVAAFIMQYQADPVELARTDPSTAKAFTAMPGWAWAAYAVAVGAGTLGVILLLARKATAVPLFFVSLIAVLVQFGYTFLGTDLVAEKGLGVAAFPALIIIVAIVQLLYARSLVTKRVLR